MEDFRKLMYGVIIAFVGVLVTWGSIVYISACGFSFNCQRGQPVVYGTPIPTLAAATLPAPDFSVTSPTIKRCSVAAVNLIGAWVSAGYSDTETFMFTDVDGKTCEANFSRDVQPLFMESNIWYPGSLSCSSCHTPDLTTAFMNMNLSTYDGIVAGSGRANGEAQGKDILGGGDWEQSLLYQMLYAPNGTTTIGRPAMPLGRPLEVPAEGPIIFAGILVQATSEAATQTPAATSGDQVARPSNPGGPSDALNLSGDANSGTQIFQVNCAPCHGPEGTQGVPNPGTDDGSVPALNLIDSTMVSSDYKTFAYNIDLFVQHGSTPAGPNPAISMPAWGDQGALNQQQIADVIAYVISLNKK